ncbi:hypothetical protein D3C72_1610590 [compost metagenome]
MPTALPSMRRPTISAPITAKATSTPSVYHMAWLRARSGLSPLCARLSTFSDRIGSTQGIRFSTRPPPSASSSTHSSELSVFGTRLGALVRSALSCCASAANTSRAPLLASAPPALAGASLGTVGSRRSGVPLAASRVLAAAEAGSEWITSSRAAGASLVALALPAGIDNFTRRVIGG